MKNLLFRMTTILLVVSGHFIGHANAQEISNWSEPENLSNTKTKSSHQTIVSDGYGFVHVFWVEDVGGPDVSEKSMGPAGNTILYRRWDGERWSATVDIIFSRGGSLSFPVSAIDEDNTLYLVWNSPSEIMLSYAPAHSALSAKDWAKPIVIAPSVGAGSRVAFLARGSGELDLIYDATNQIFIGGKDGNIYHVRSTDRGLNWSSPVKITDIDRQSESIAVFPRLERDGNDKLHAVWYVADPPSYTGSAVYYSNSIDNGNTWKLPEKVDEISDLKNWASSINIGVIYPNEIHRVWVCGILPGRCHQWSNDGGETWSSVQKLFGELHSRADWDALATDQSGVLYWIMQLRYPYALYYTYWDQDHWVSPPLVVHNRDPIVSEGHGVQLTINQGNQLHLVVHHPDVFEVWHIWGTNPAGELKETQPTPTPIPTSENLVFQSLTPSPMSVIQPGQSNQISTAEQFSAIRSPSEGLLIGILPVLFILLGYIIYKIITREIG